MNHTKTKSILLTILLATQAISCSNAKQLALQGIEAYNEGKKITALRYFEEALKKDPKNPYALYGKGKLMLDSIITVDIGKRMLQKSIQGLPDKYKTDAYYSLAKSFAMSNQYNEALKTLSKLEEQKLMNQESALNMVAYNIQLRKFSKSRQLVEKYIEQFPDSTKLLIMASVIEAKYYGNFSKAIEHLESAATLDPGDPEVVKKSAIIYYKSGNTAKTIENLEKLKTFQTGENEIQKIDTWIELVHKRKWEISI